MDAILSKPTRKKIFDMIGKFRNRMVILSYKKQNITNLLEIVVNFLQMSTLVLKEWNVIMSVI